MNDRPRIVARWAPRAPWVLRLAPLRLLVLLVVFCAAAGCGRSDLLDDTGLSTVVDASLPDATPTPDAGGDGGDFDATIDDAGGDASDAADDGDASGPDGGSCSPASCPTGCCASGACVGGNDLLACGGFGTQCVDCKAIGFAQCDSALKACATVPDGGVCGPSNCKGCCESFGGVDTCLAGQDPNACGSSGQRCSQCVNQGLTCDATSRSCVAAPTCGPANCAGCCQGNVCVTGDQASACGTLGHSCDDCTALGGQCAPAVGDAGKTGTGGVCQVVPPVCGPQSCAGCCQGATCLPGTVSAACGAGGATCVSCGTAACAKLEASGGGACQGPPPPSCGPTNCNGCCQNNVCVAGTQAGACGSAGQQCSACGPGSSCAAAPNGAGGVCQTPPPVCSASNCQGCCTAGGLCARGNQNVACGASGGACIDCTQSAEVCGAGSGSCTAPPPPQCGPQNCLGCCDAAGQCHGGFLGNQCGSQGNSCTDCTSRGSTCDAASTPRACHTGATTCPATYPSCASGTTTASPVTQRVCSQDVLQNAQAACAGGPNTPSCVAFFQFVSATSPACKSCLSPFDVDFIDAKGLFACLAPFVSAACNQSTGCAIDCQAKSCGLCTNGTGPACENEVRQTQCQTYFQKSGCVTPAFLGAGAFCNPLLYGGNFGAWLQAVGGSYCGQ